MIFYGYGDLCRRQKSPKFLGQISSKLSFYSGQFCLSVRRADVRCGLVVVIFSVKKLVLGLGLGVFGSYLTALRKSGVA